MTEEALHFEDAAEERQFAAMSRIHALGWHTTYMGAVPADYLDEVITEDHWVPFFREDAKQGIVRGLLLYRGTEPVACGNYGPARTGPSPRQSAGLVLPEGYEGWGEVISFYTHPAEKNKGYGGMLMEEMLRRLRRDGYRDCCVMVLRENEPARRFYAGHGFAPDGSWVEVPFPRHTVCVDLRYTRKL